MAAEAKQEDKRERQTLTIFPYGPKDDLQELGMMSYFQYRLTVKGINLQEVKHLMTRMRIMLCYREKEE